jgi:hypothetical protein
VVTLQTTHPGNTCFEGDLVTLTAATITGIPTVDANGFKYLWTYDADDTQVTKIDNGVMTYTCNTVGTRTVSVKLVTLGNKYSLKPASAAAVIDVTNGLLAFGEVHFEYTTADVPNTAITAAYVGEDVTLVIPFTDSSKGNTHHVTIKWQDGSEIYRELERAPLVKSFSVSHKFQRPAQGGGDIGVTITIKDNAAIPSVETTTAMITISRKVRAH